MKSKTSQILESDSESETVNPHIPSPIPSPISSLITRVSAFWVLDERLGEILIQRAKAKSSKAPIGIGSILFATWNV